LNWEDPHLSKRTALLREYFYLKSRQKLWKLTKENHHTKPGKVIGIILAILFITSISGVVYLYLDISRLVGEQLKKAVLIQTTNRYQLVYDTLRVDLLKRSVTFDRLAILPNLTDSLVTEPPQFRFESKLAHLSGIDWKALIRSHELNLASFQLDSPLAELGQNNPLGINSLTSSVVSLGDTVKLPFLKHIHIDTVLIKNAQIDIDSLIYLPPGASLLKLNLEAIGFSLGGKKQTPTPFPFDVKDLFLKINNLEHNLPDGLHQLFARESSLSLINRQIAFHGLSIQPVDPMVKTSRNLYTVSIPLAIIHSRQVEFLFSSDTIRIDRLEFFRPDITIKFGGKTGTGTPLNEIDFYQFIENKLDWVQIDEFRIKQANLKMIAHKSDQPGQLLEGLTIDLHGFRADPSSYRDPKRILSSGSFSLELEKLTINHTDGVHRFIIDQMKVDTQKNLITTGTLSFKPIKSTLEQPDVVRVDVIAQKLQFSGFSFLNAYHRQVYPMKSLWVDQPVVEVWEGISKAASTGKRDQSLLLEKVSPYLKGIYVDNARISKGALHYHYFNKEREAGQFSTRFNFDLKDLSVDSVTFYKTDKFFFARDFNLYFSEVKLDLADRLHVLQTDSVSLSSQGQSAEVINLRLKPLMAHPDSLLNSNKSMVFDLHFPNLTMKGAGFHRAFFDKVLEIENFEIEKPKLQFKKYGKWKHVEDKIDNQKDELYSLFSDFLVRISIRSLSMNEGELAYYQHIEKQRDIDFTNKFSVKLTNFELDSLSSLRKNKLFYSDFIDLSLKNQTFDMADGIHRLEASEVAVLTGQNRFFIRDAKLFPDMKSDPFKKAPVAFFATIPLIQADGVKIADVFTKGNIPVERLLLLKPQIQVLFQPHLKGMNTDTLQKPLIIPKKLNELAIGKIIIEDGNLRLTDFEKGKFDNFAQTGINFLLEKLKVSKNKNQFSTQYVNFEIVLDNAHFNLSDQLHTLTVNRLNYNLKQSDLNVSGLHIKPNQQDGDEKSQFDVLVPFLSLKAIGFEKLIKERVLHASELSLTNPIIGIKQPGPQATKKAKPYRLDWYPKISKELKEVAIGRIKIENAELERVHQSRTRLKNMNLYGNNFLLNEKTNQEERLLYCQQVEWEMGNLTGKTNNGFYSYSIDHLNADQTGRISMDGFKLNPALSREQFFRKKGYQDDFWNIELPTAEVRGFDLKNFFETDEFRANYLDLKFGAIDVFRDKRLSINPARKGKLPQQLLREMKQKINLDSMALSCPKFIYHEWESGAINESHVFFTQIRAKGNHICNIPSAMNKNPIMGLELNSLLMDEGSLMADLRFDLLSDRNLFQFKASCGTMALSELNPIIEPGMKVSVREGMCRNLEVEFEANEDSSSGQMGFAYDGLKISVLSAKEGMVKEERFLSFLINNLALKDQNPRQGKELIPVGFNNARDKQRSVIHYVWRSVYAGIKETFGLKEKEKKENHH